MVGYHKKIERPREFRQLSRRGRDLLALGEPVSVARSQTRAKGAGIHRERGMEMCVAEQWPRWEVSSGPGRIRPLGWKDLFGRFLINGANVGGRVAFLPPNRMREEGCYQSGKRHA